MDSYRSRVKSRPQITVATAHTRPSELRGPGEDHVSRHDYSYRSQVVTVFVKEVRQEWVPWRVVISSAHVPWPIGKYDHKSFPTAGEAAEYGFKAARSKIDTPPPKAGLKKQKTRRD